jgi:hypothetical protein
MAAAESSPIASPTWFSRLFFRAMAQHSQTSRALRRTRAGSVLGEHNAHFVSLLHNLSSLEMSINAGAGRSPHGMSRRRWGPSSPGLCWHIR